MNQDIQNNFIVEPFNVDSFNKDFPNIDVHKNSMGTLLYYPESIKPIIK